MRQWFSMKATEDNAAEIEIYDEIGVSWWGEDTVSAKSFLADLKALGDVDTITLRVNSPGGDVFDGVAIHNAIKTHKATVTAHVDGIAASAASYIVMAADKIVMPANTFMLIHGASGLAWGNADTIRSLADDLDRVDKSMTATYVARSGSTTAKVKALMGEDRLMDATEAKSLGFADEVTSEKKMAATFSLRMLPKAAAEKVRAQTGAEQGDPPPPVSDPEGPGEQPVADPAPNPNDPPSDPPPAPSPADPQPTAQVIDLNAAKAAGVAEHQAYVRAVTDLCTLARAPERVGAYVRANTPVETVRAELLSMSEAEPVIMPHNPVVERKQTAKAWDKITEKLNARVK